LTRTLGETKATTVELSGKDAILFDQIVGGVRLAFIEPAGQAGHNEREGIEQCVWIFSPDTKTPPACAGGVFVYG